MTSQENTSDVTTKPAGNKPTILFVSTRLGGGGAEKHLVRVANALVDEFNIHIAVLRSGGSYEELVRDQIQIHHVGPTWLNSWTLGSAWLGTGRLAGLITKIQPKCMVSFLEPASWATHFARKKSGVGTPHLVAVQNNFSSAINSFRGMIKGQFRPGIEDAIRQADGIVAISEGVAGDVVSHFPNLNRAKITTIYNAAFENPPVSVSPIERKDRRPHQLVACGRLAEQKGFEDLLKAVQLTSRQIDVGLWILGVGPLEKNFKDLVRDLGVEDRVSFVGFQDDPLPWFAGADLFVLSSRWEGFGNVIVEAMSVSTAVVSTACPHGPDEIIDHNVNGFLVPVSDTKKMAEGIVSVMSDPNLRQQFATEGKKRSNDFSATLIAGQYANLISSYVDS